MGLLSALIIFVVAPLVPKSAVERLETHKRLVQGVSFTLAAFAVWLSVLWRWHRRVTFWISATLFLTLHVLCVWLFSTFVQPILVWQWGILLAFESYVGIFFIEYLTRWLNRFQANRT